MITPIKTSHGIAIIVTSFLISLFFVNWASKQIDFTALSILPSSQIAAVADFDSSLVAHYTFDGNTNDSAGSNNGTASGGPTYTTGKIGQAFNFDGVDDTVKVNTSTNLNNMSALTISFWMNAKLCNVNANGAGLVDKSGFLISGWGIWTSSSCLIRFSVDYDGATNLVKASGVNSLVPNRWDFWTVTWDGSSAKANVHIYKNSVEDLSTSGNTDGVGGRVSDSSQNLYLGNISALSRQLIGSLDDVRIYNRALSAEEITKLYALGSASTADTTPPSVPANFAATAVSSSQINLSWSPSTDDTAVSGYKIYRNGIQITTTIDTFYTNTNLSPNTTYTYTISAYDAANNESSQSTSVSATTQSQQQTQTYTLIVSKSGTGAGIVAGTGISCGSDCAESLSQGIPITLTATSQPGSTFTGWSGGNCSGIGACTVILNADTAVTATFNAQSGNRVDRLNSSGGIISSFTTIQPCADAAQAGETCLVYPGKYPEKVIVKRSGTNGNPIIFKGISIPNKSLANFSEKYNPNSPYVTPGNYLANAVIKGFMVQHAGFGSTYSATSFVRIENFEITSIPTNSLAAIYLDGTSNIEIINNFIHDLNPSSSFYGGIHATSNPNTSILIEGNTLWRYQGWGILITGQNWIVRNNELSHALDSNTDTGLLVGGDGDGIRFFGSGHIIEKNYIHDLLEKGYPGGGEQLGNPHQDCFQTYSMNSSTDYAYNILFKNNYCDNVGQGLMASDTSEKNGTGNNIYNLTFVNNIFSRTLGNSIILSNVDYFTFINNVISEPRQWYAISISSGSHHATIINNIFYGLKTNAGPLPQPTDLASLVGSQWDYNIYYPDFTWPPKQSGLDQHSLFGIDPEFVDRDNGNYRLKSTSPAINIGADLSSTGFSTDIIGISRPQGSAWDIGAYEYTGTVVNPPPIVYTPGDFNRDGIVNTQDFSLLKLVWNQSNTTYDLNTDGIVNSLDYVIMVRNWTG